VLYFFSNIYEDHLVKFLKMLINKKLLDKLLGDVILHIYSWVCQPHSTTANLNKNMDALVIQVRF